MRWGSRSAIWTERTWTRSPGTSASHWWRAAVAIRDGATATLELWRLLLEPEYYSRRERERQRRALLAYCERDSWATVKLLDRLRALAGLAPTAPAFPPAADSTRQKGGAVQLDFGF